MRLIDADELKEYVRKIGFYCDTDADKEYTIEQIDTLFSTVETIPIEWIKKYAAKFEDKIAEERLHFGISRGKGVYWRGENEEWVGIDFTNPITEMLENWGKENE